MSTRKQNSPEQRRILVTTKRRAQGGVQDASPAIVQMAQSRAEHRVEHRHAMIAEAAYFRAARRGFEPGCELEDWLAAELEVEAAERLSVLCPCDAITPAEQASWNGLRN